MATTSPDRRIERLARLVSTGRAGQVFGAFGHHFRCNPVIDPSVLDAAERSGGFALPPAYRRHLIEVGNGGAGPGYGLFPFGTVGDTAEDARPIDAAWGDPAAPFPHDGAWNLPPSDLVPPADLSEDEEHHWFAQLDEAYLAPRLTDGSMPIAHLGCGMWVLLVVSGDRSGEIWLDDRASDRGIHLLEARGFDAWFDGWLAAAEGEVGSGT
ncbi:MAG: SMI1/KNR4 family protein [Aquihabitans sp.]